MEDQIIAKKRDHLNDYDILKRRYNQMGISYKQMKLLKAFNFQSTYLVSLTLEL